MVGVIENMAWFTGDTGKRYEVFSSRGRRRASPPTLGVPLLGQVPLVPELREGGDVGRPIVGHEARRRSIAGVSHDRRAARHRPHAQARVPGPSCASTTDRWAWAPAPWHTRSDRGFRRAIIHARRAGLAGRPRSAPGRRARRAADRAASARPRAVAASYPSSPRSRRAVASASSRWRTSYTGFVASMPSQSARAPLIVAAVLRLAEGRQRLDAVVERFREGRASRLCRCRP